jgi:hypothetical protein
LRTYAYSKTLLDLGVVYITVAASRGLTSKDAEQARQEFMDYCDFWDAADVWVYNENDGEPRVVERKDLP